jgi:hypothetical protein
MGSSTCRVLRFDAVLRTVFSEVVGSAIGVKPARYCSFTIAEALPTQELKQELRRTVINWAGAPRIYLRKKGRVWTRARVGRETKRHITAWGLMAGVTSTEAGM